MLSDYQWLTLYRKNIDLASCLIKKGRVLPVFLEEKARYATALNRAITRDDRTTFIVSALKG